MSVAIKTLGPRRPSLATIELKLFFQRPVRVAGVIKHLFSGIYNVAMCYLYFYINPADQRAQQVYAPMLMCVITGSLAVLHFAGLFRTCVVGAMRSRFWDDDTWRPLARYISPTTQLLAMHLTGVLCQSYQAYHGSEYLVDHASAFAFVVVVALNCFVTPWFFLSKHRVVQSSIVPLIESVLGFFLSVLFQTYVFLVPSIYYSSSEAHQHDAKFNAQMSLVTRWIIASSPLDLVTKIVIQFSSYAALRKLVEATHVPVHMSPASPSVHSGRLVARQSSGEVSQHFQFQFRHNNTRVLYAVCTSVFGVVLVGLSGAANWPRSGCSNLCAFEFAPWGTRDCQCCYVEINCALLSHRANITIDSLLRPDQLGHRVYFIDIRRCPLPHGIPLDTLAPFQNIYGLYIAFSNMTQWSTDDLANTTTLALPDSLTALRISYSNLTAVPRLLASVPSHLIYLRLEGAPITTIPEMYVKAWATVPSISINEANLSKIPVGLLASTTLGWLELRGNRIAYVPPEWRPQVGFTLDLSANELMDGPWHIAQPGVTLELSSNPIASVSNALDETLLQKRTVVLDDTPFCASSSSSSPCQSKCARLCESKFIGNGNCDWSCYNAACAFDGGDCDSYGFT
ncbi:Aste57867_9348 [Aphanomyces stellatus]|uniref:Aste57867_9348 protein n=1 Tax=Aphanomyces stellatus TaxID=120398 RepID=A0A485KMZ5_9STRA|nr:hypothetical protein As57867_009312 [Aphanomyces stellatus]VFT86229.1 Aste57867_9348 [Aphanomyces stellatus]